MDFSTFDPSVQADEGADMEIIHPVTGEIFMDGDKPVTICVRGFESKTIKDLARKHARKAQNGRKVDIEKNGFELLVAATIGWSGVSWEDEPLECTPKNVEMLYRERDFIGQQVLSFMSDAANFFTEQSTD